MDVEIEHDGAVGTEQTIEVAGRDGDAVDRKWVNPTWSTDPAPFTVRASPKDYDETQELDSSDLPRGVPIHEMLRVSRDAGLAFFHKAVYDPAEQCQHAGENRALDDSPNG